MSREAYAVVGLGVIAAGAMAIEPLLRWAQITGQLGLEWSVVVPSMGPPLLCLVATLVAAWSYGLRSVAAGAIIAIGLLTVWGSAWRFASPIGWVGLAIPRRRAYGDRDGDRSPVRADRVSSGRPDGGVRVRVTGHQAPDDGQLSTDERLLRSSTTCSGGVVANRCIPRAMTPVQPVWWLAPRPAPLSPWKYS